MLSIRQIASLSPLRIQLLVAQRLSTEARQGLALLIFRGAPQDQIDACLLLVQQRDIAVEVATRNLFGHVFPRALQEVPGHINAVNPNMEIIEVFDQGIQATAEVAEQAVQAAGEMVDQGVNTLANAHQGLLIKSVCVGGVCLMLFFGVRYLKGHKGKINTRLPDVDVTKDIKTSKSGFDYDYSHLFRYLMLGTVISCINLGVLASCSQLAVKLDAGPVYGLICSDCLSLKIDFD